MGFCPCGVMHRIIQCTPIRNECFPYYSNSFCLVLFYKLLETSEFSKGLYYTLHPFNDSDLFLYNSI